MKRWYTIKIDLVELLDRHSILSVKYNNCENIKVKTALNDQIKDLECKLTRQGSCRDFQNLIRSHEYHQLYEANLEIFFAIKLINAGKEGDMSARELNNINKKRTSAKRNLSAKFLGLPPVEIKME